MFSSTRCYWQGRLTEDISWLFAMNLFLCCCFCVCLPSQSVLTTTVPGWATVWDGGITVSSTCSSCRSPSSPSSSSPSSSRTSFYVSSCEVFCTLLTLLHAVPEPAAVGGCCGTLWRSGPAPSFLLVDSRVLQQREPYMSEDQCTAQNELL